MAPTILRGRGDGRHARQGGFTYVMLLFALALFGIGLAKIGEAWSRVQQRDKEQELLDIGNAFVKAIGDYYEHSPGSARRYPADVVSLVEDRRFVGIARHLRKLYRDPMTGQATWGLIAAPDGGIMGVFSLSPRLTLRQQPVALPSGTVVTGKQYSDWKFIYLGKP